MTKFPWSLGILVASIIIVMTATYLIIEIDRLRAFCWYLRQGHWYFDWHLRPRVGYVKDWFDGPIYQVRLIFLTITVSSG
jgi:hypothetical protein